MHNQHNAPPSKHGSGAARKATVRINRRRALAWIAGASIALMSIVPLAIVLRMPPSAQAAYLAFLTSIAASCGLVGAGWVTAIIASSGRRP